MALGWYAREFLKKYSKDGVIVDPALRKYVTSTSIGAESLNIYLRTILMFTERFELSPQELYELRLKELRSDDPMEWDIISGKIKHVMREMEDGAYTGDKLLGRSPWPQSALLAFREVRLGRAPLKKGPTTCHQVSKALTSFFEVFGSRFEIRIKNKDMPQGDSQGAKPIRVVDLAEVLKHPGEENPLRNVAIGFFIKGWGPRAGDVGAFKIEHYLEAKQRIVYNDSGEAFLAFDPIRTTKEGIHGRPHLGPEEIQAIDRYLEVERPGAGLSEPLFLQHDKRTGLEGSISSGATSNMFKGMVHKALGKIGGKHISCHSIRKSWVTLMQAGGMPEKWAKYIQGKSSDPYNVPKELQGPDGAEILMESYMNAYESMRINREGAELRKRVQEIEEEKDADKQRLNYLEMRMSLYDSILKDVPLFKQYLEDQKNNESE